MSFLLPSTVRTRSARFVWKYLKRGTSKDIWIEHSSCHTVCAFHISSSLLQRKTTWDVRKAEMGVFKATNFLLSGWELCKHAPKNTHELYLTDVFQPFALHFACFMVPCTAAFLTEEDYLCTLNKTRLLNSWDLCRVTTDNTQIWIEYKTSLEILNDKSVWSTVDAT